MRRHIQRDAACGQGRGQVELRPVTVHVVEVEGVGRGEELLQQRIGLEFAKPLRVVPEPVRAEAGDRRPDDPKAERQLDPGDQIRAVNAVALARQDAYRLGAFVVEAAGLPPFLPGVARHLLQDGEDPPDGCPPAPRVRLALGDPLDDAQDLGGRGPGEVPEGARRCAGQRRRCRLQLRAGEPRDGGGDERLVAAVVDAAVAGGEGLQVSHRTPP
ncbi:hypothetical protein ACFUIW_16320 [Streptomyces sp. NPDC057245]|uniref:hypothetical protein n=1 Tax=Streptomyces sp. NPDC057245 TaxID=3346065 RepID=UPI0036336230